MPDKKEISRRQFVSAGASAAVVAALPKVNFSSPESDGAKAFAPQSTPVLQNSDWKEQGVENLSKSPYAKLRNVPVRAVTIQSGLWRSEEHTSELQSRRDLVCR